MLALPYWPRPVRGERASWVSGLRLETGCLCWCRTPLARSLLSSSGPRHSRWCFGAWLVSVSRPSLGVRGTQVRLLPRAFILHVRFAAFTCRLISEKLGTLARDPRRRPLPPRPIQHENEQVLPRHPVCVCVCLCPKSLSTRHARRASGLGLWSPCRLTRAFFGPSQKPSTSPGCHSVSPSRQSRPSVFGLYSCSQGLGSSGCLQSHCVETQRN